MQKVSRADPNILKRPLLMSCSNRKIRKSKNTKPTNFFRIQILVIEIPGSKLREKVEGSFIVFINCFQIQLYRDHREVKNNFPEEFEDLFSSINEEFLDGNEASTAGLDPSKYF